MRQKQTLKELKDAKMVSNGWTVREGQDVKIFLKNGYVYTGEVLELTEAFLKINDWKTDKKVTVNAAEVSRIEELEGDS